MKMNERRVTLVGKRARKSIREAAARVVATIPLVLSLVCFVSPTGTAAGQELRLLIKHHSVVLKWKPSATPNVKYNVYRSTVHGSNYKKMNSRPLKELTYTDKDVERGTRYYYVTRSMDGGGTESANSNEAVVTVP
jgi:hypothetical protein